jgi:DNA-binding LacI/PurR family transcriptional regulator
MIKVARRAKASQATVSRVINNDPNVSDAKRNAVLKAIKELGYVPRPRSDYGAGSGAATSLRNKTIALLLLDRSHEKHPVLSAAKFRGVVEAAAEQGLNLSILPVYDDGHIPKTFRPKEWSGVVLWGRQAPDSVLKALGELPQVWISSHGNPGEEQIMSVNEVVGRLAARYLMNRGHQSFGLLSLSTSHPGLAMRSDGFRYALRCEGLEMRALVAGGKEDLFEEISEQALAAAMLPLVEQLVAMKNRPTGWFIPDDQMTAAVYSCLSRFSLRVGEDIEIISCNNETPYLMGLNPRPATIDLAPHLTGRQAVQQCLWKLMNPSEERETVVMVAPALVEGDRTSWSK